MKQVELDKLFEKHQAQFKKVSAMFHTIICAGNDMASSAMVDAISEIRKAGLFKQEVKKACNDAMAVYRDYENRVMIDMHNVENGADKRQLLRDYFDSVNERISPHVLKLRMAMKSCLDKKDIPDSYLKSYILCADQFLVYAIFLFDKFFDECPKIPYIKLRDTFIKARLDKCRRKWDVVVEKICKDCLNIDFNEDKNVILAFNIIEKHITSEQMINSSGEEALELNPEWK